MYLLFFFNDNSGRGPYKAIIHHIQLRTTWWHQWGRGILKNDSSVGVTTASSKYKCRAGKLSAHTSRLGLYGSQTAARGWEWERPSHPSYRSRRIRILPRWVSVLGEKKKRNSVNNWSKYSPLFIYPTSFSLYVFSFCETSLNAAGLIWLILFSKADWLVPGFFFQNYRIAIRFDTSWNLLSPLLWLICTSFSEK